MKFLIPSAKQMSDLSDGKFVELAPASQAVLGQLGDLSTEELAKFYDISDVQAVTEAERWQALATGRAKSYPAMDLYDGLMYRQFKPVLKSDKARDFASQHVLIATALYGLIAANTPIAPHRLDFMKSLKVNDKLLKAYWKTQYDTCVSTNQDEVLVSLLSSEFEQVFSPALRRLFLRIQFLEEVDGRLKRHSTISKKGRGQLLAYCIEHQVQTLEALRVAKFDGYSYRADLSSELDWVYVKKIEK